MEFRLIKIHELKELLDDKKFWQQPELPISKSRALSYVNNPNAEDEDYAVYCATDKGKVISYLGFLPDFFHIDEQKHKFYWLSTWWANEKYKGIGLILLSKALKKCPYPYGISDFSIEAGHIYDRTKLFDNLQILNGRKFYSRFIFNKIIPYKYPKLQWFRPLLQLSDNFLNLIYGIFKWIWNKRIKLPDSYSLEQIPKLDNESAKFINVHNQDEITKRSEIELRWMTDYPWVIENNKEQNRYRFLCSAKNFRYEWNKLYYKKELIGLFLLKYIDGQLEAPYIYNKKNHGNVIGHAIANRIYSLGAEVFLSFNDNVINQVIASDFPFITIRKESRRIIISKKRWDINIERPFFQDGDGDRGFA